MANMNDETHCHTTPLNFEDDCCDNHDIDYADEMFYWKSKAIELETKYNELSVQYEQMKALKEQLELHIMQSEQAKPKKQKRKVSKYQQDFKVFFDQKKKDVKFVASIKNKLQQLGMIGDNDNVPWYIVRDECKRMFALEQ